MGRSNIKAFGIGLASAALVTLSGQAMAAPTVQLAQSRTPSAAQTPPSAPLTQEQKAGCGAVLVMLGVVATQYPQIFGSSTDSRNARVMLQTFGIQGRVLLGEAFQSGTASGAKPEKVYEDGIAALIAAYPPRAGESSEAAGKRISLSLLNRCTGLEIN